MALAKLSELLSSVKDNSYAIGSFNVSNMEMAMGAIKAAEKMLRRSAEGGECFSATRNDIRAYRRDRRARLRRRRCSAGRNGKQCPHPSRYCQECRCASLRRQSVRRALR